MSCMCNLQVFLVLAVSSNTIMATFRDPDDGITRARWKRQVTEATGDNHPTQPPLDQYSGRITGLILVAALFVFSLLIVGSMIIYCLHIRREHSKRAKGDGHTIMSNSSAEPFDPPATQPGTWGILNSQESDRQRFLKRSNSSPPEEAEQSQRVVVPNTEDGYNTVSHSEPYAYAFTSPSPPTKLSDHYEVDENYGDPYWHPSSMEDELRMQLLRLKVQEISREDIRLHEHLGSGQFGTVNRGVWSPGTCRNSAGVEVAVKSLEESLTEEERVKFLQEAAIMGQFKHPNVIRIFGIITTSNPMMIVCELMHKGDLHQYLLSLRPSSGIKFLSEMPAVLLSFSRQIASGMGYLAGKSFIHRDLAARNILVSENDICKIADFGLSRDLQKEEFYVSRGGKIPVKWTAPEALKYRKYSVSSDVWSYGVLLYEIWAMGTKPFDDCTNNEALQKVLKGYRLPPPPGCPKQVYELMIKCWHPDPDSRPLFCYILLLLQRPDFQLLRWSAEDEVVYSEKARTLGGPVEDGVELYAELQESYSKSSI